jgi:hypothetical protein
MKRILLSILSIIALNIHAQSEVKQPFLYSNKFSVLAGLIQPIALKGWNAEVNYTTKRMIFDYSHGVSLDPPAGGEFKTQQTELHLPYSTGFGIGYRITSFLDVRFEPKLHSWEVYYKGEAQTPGNRIQDYKTFTLGIGVYYRLFPFKNSKITALQGITAATSLRFWPNIGTTLRDNKFTYANKLTGNTETQKASNIGMGNTPLILNISVGYTFGGK